MTNTAVETARTDWDIAFYGGASSEAVLTATRDLRAAREATESLDERAFRLGVEAADKDAEAERFMEGAADAAGRAAGRRARWGDCELCRSFDREEQSCLRLAELAMDEAIRLRSQASAIRRSQRFAADYMAIVQAAE